MPKNINNKNIICMIKNVYILYNNALIVEAQKCKQETKTI